MLKTQVPSDANTFVSSDVYTVVLTNTEQALVRGNRSSLAPGCALRPASFATAHLPARPASLRLSTSSPHPMPRHTYRCLCRGTPFCLRTRPSWTCPARRRFWEQVPTNPQAWSTRCAGVCVFVCSCACQAVVTVANPWLVSKRCSHAGRQAWGIHLGQGNSVHAATPCSNGCMPPAASTPAPLCAGLPDCRWHAIPRRDCGCVGPAQPPSLLPRVRCTQRECLKLRVHRFQLLCPAWRLFVHARAGCGAEHGTGAGAV